MKQKNSLTKQYWARTASMAEAQTMQQKLKQTTAQKAILIKHN